MAVRTDRAYPTAADAYQFAEANPTGLIDGGELNIGPGVNDIEVLAGTGVIVDSYTTPDVAPVTTPLSWPQINTPITASPASAGSFVFFTMSADIGGLPGPVAGTTLGVLKQYNVVPTQDVQRDEIRLGVALHNGSVWNEVSTCSVINASAHTLLEYMLAVFGPTYVIDGGVVTQGAAFTVDQGAGTIWEPFRNWHVDKKNPHREALPAATGIQWRYVNRDFSSVGALTSTVDPSMYDPAGTVIAVPTPTGTATVQRLYVDPADNYWMLWGQEASQNAQEAASRLPDRAVINLLLDNCWLLARLVVSTGQSDWDDDQAFMVYPPTISEYQP